MQTRYVKSPSGLGSQNSIPIEFGLGTHSSVDSVIIKWTIGIVQTLTDVEVNQFLTVYESVRGDLNGEGNVTPADASIALQIAVIGGWDPAAGVSGDNRVTARDALMILQAVAEAISLWGGG